MIIVGFYVDRICAYFAQIKRTLSSFQLTFRIIFPGKQNKIVTTLIESEKLFSGKISLKSSPPPVRPAMTQFFTEFFGGAHQFQPARNHRTSPHAILSF